MALQDRVSNFLAKRGWQRKYILLVQHYMTMLYEQVVAVVPISIQLVALLAIFFQGRTVSQPGELAGGLVAAIIGLTLFVDALRIAVMPLGEMLGKELPAKMPQWVVLLVAFVLGILCTYAEPAMASLRPLARLVSRSKTPYLHLMLNELQEPMIFSVGLGVGIAAVLGTLRFVKGWSLKPMVAYTVLPTLFLTCYMQWGNPDLAPLIGLAWDCGAVTTGPVTVPILLAMGIGVMRTSREKEKARAALKGAIHTQQPSGLDGFGIVTLASILPIMCVCTLSIITSFIYDKDYILNTESQSDLDEAVDQSPLREVVFAFRAILPLSTFLVLLVLFVLRSPLPPLTVFLLEEETNAKAAQSRGGSEADGSVEMTARPSLDEGGSSAAVHPAPASDSPEAPPTADGTHAHTTSRQSLFPLLVGVLLAVVGQMLFNIGLTYGFTSLGDQVGYVLPSSFLAVPNEEGSPYYDYVSGVAITLSMVFLLGILATRAEPALNVLGMTVEKLSKGKFTRKALVLAVCIGVGLGMTIGATKILFSVPIIIILLVKYTIACGLTYFADPDFMAIAWDSAGVTTGPVTVPFVLSLGIGFNKASGTAEGFGILTAASVAPIISVLIVDQLRRGLEQAVVTGAISVRRASQLGLPVPAELLQEWSAQSQNSARGGGGEEGGRSGGGFPAAAAASGSDARSETPLVLRQPAEQPGSP